MSEPNYDWTRGGRLLTAVIDGLSLHYYTCHQDW